jgi:hypothetical protein
VVEDRLLRQRRLGRHMVRALQLRKQGAGESAIVGGPREDQHQIKEAKINKELVGGNMYQSLGPLVGEYREKSR